MISPGCCGLWVGLNLDHFNLFLRILLSFEILLDYTHKGIVFGLCLNMEVAYPRMAPSEVVHAALDFFSASPQSSSTADSQG